MEGLLTFAKEWLLYNKVCSKSFTLYKCSCKSLTMAECPELNIQQGHRGESKMANGIRSYKQTLQLSIKLLSPSGCISRKVNVDTIDPFAVCSGK